MTVIKFGSARFDENGKIKNGKEGDQTGKEVSEQTFYMDKKGWLIIRPKSPSLAEELAKAMILACKNDNIGYNQYERAQVVKAGIDTKTKVNADCSSLVRACCKYCGFDPGNFYTVDEVEILYKTGQFLPVKMLADKSELYRGDILVTNGRGHTVIVTRGPIRPAVTYFEKYDGPETCSIVDALHYIGARYTKSYRALIAEANGIEEYTGTAAQNGRMLALLKAGELVKP